MVKFCGVFTSSLVPEFRTAEKSFRAVDPFFFHPIPHLCVCTPDDHPETRMTAEMTQNECWVHLLCLVWQGITFACSWAENWKRCFHVFVLTSHISLDYQHNHCLLSLRQYQSKKTPFLASLEHQWRPKVVMWSRWYQFKVFWMAILGLGRKKFQDILHCVKGLLTCSFFWNFNSLCLCGCFQKYLAVPTGCLKNDELICCDSMFWK